MAYINKAQPTAIKSISYAFAGGGLIPGYTKNTFVLMQYMAIPTNRISMPTYTMFYFSHAQLVIFLPTTQALPAVPATLRSIPPTSAGTSPDNEE